METIKVYHALGRNVFFITLCFLFAGLIFYSLHIYSGFGRIIAWLGILFFGLGGLFMLCLMLKERITHTPYYLITEDGIISNMGSKAWEIRFADVERFFVTNFKQATFIGIQYKKDVEALKIESASKFGRAVRHFNQVTAASQEALVADGLTIKPKDLCDLLNERLKQS